MRRVAPEDSWFVIVDEFQHLRKRFAFHAGLAALGSIGFGKTRIAGERPVHGVGVIETELDAVLVAGGFEFAQRVVSKFARFDDIVVIDFGIKHRHAVMVHGGDDDVAHAGFLGRAHPLVGIE